MHSRFGISVGLAFLFALLLVLPVFAGGWAVITLDALPTAVTAGEPLTLGFTVRQHGITPMGGLTPTITVNLHKEQEFVVHANPDGQPGHYTATLTFPKEGEWSWSIQAFTMDQRMPMLTVAAPAAAKAQAPEPEKEPVAGSISLLLIVRAVAGVSALAGLVLAYRRRSRLALGLAAAALLVGAATFITGLAVPEAEAQSQPADPSTSQAEFGERLFVAKGCLTCHLNSKVTLASEYQTIQMGAPDLTKFSASPEALRLRLKDPSSVKSDTRMPNLNLSAAEIEALITFINSK